MKLGTAVFTIFMMWLLWCVGCLLVAKQETSSMQNADTYEGITTPKAFLPHPPPKVISRHFEWITDTLYPEAPHDHLHYFCREVEVYDNGNKAWTPYIGKYKWSDNYPLWVNEEQCAAKENNETN